MGQRPEAEQLLRAGAGQHLWKGKNWGFLVFLKGCGRSAFGHRSAQLFPRFLGQQGGKHPFLYSQACASSHHQHQCCWALSLAHMLVAMAVGSLLAGAPGWANLDRAGGNHLGSEVLLVLLGASWRDRAKGDPAPSTTRKVS